jgi:hypothetical protein
LRGNWNYTVSVNGSDDDNAHPQQEQQSSAETNGSSSDIASAIPNPPYLLSKDIPVQATLVKKKKRISCWAWFTIISVVIGLLFCGAMILIPRLGDIVAASDTGGPMSVTRDMYNSMIQHNYDQAYQDLAPNMAVRYSLQSMKEQWKIFEEYIGAPVSLGNTTVLIRVGSANKAEGKTALLRPGGGVQYIITLRYEKINSVWKVSDAQPGLVPGP